MKRGIFQTAITPKQTDLYIRESILRYISAVYSKFIHNMDLDSLKYAELQRLAKEVGMKANMKVNRVY